MTVYECENLQVPWTESPFFDQLFDEADLSDVDADLVRRFARDGVVVFDPEVPSDLLDRLHRGLRQSHPDLVAGTSTRVQDAWRTVPEVRMLATWPRILDRLRLLYRREPLPFQTLNFEFGTEQRTHADSIHFQTHPANWMAGVWVALEDIDAGNGPLHYVPGSHRLPCFGPDELGIASDFAAAYAEYEDFIDALVGATGGSRVALEVPRGHAVVWAANVLHGGSPIRDEGRTRRSQVTHYYFDGCTYYTPMSSEVFLGRVHFRTSDLIDIRTGAPIGHRYKGHPFDPPHTRFQPVHPARYGGDPASIDIVRAREIYWRMRGAARDLRNRWRR